MDEFGAGNKTIYVVFDEESEFSGLRTQKLSPDQVFFFRKNVPQKTLRKIINFLINFLIYGDMSPLKWP